MNTKKVVKVSAKNLLSAKLADRLPPPPPPPVKMRIASFKKYKKIVKSDTQLTDKIIQAYTEYINTCAEAAKKLDKVLEELK